MAQQQIGFRFTNLPTEIRLMIYSYIFVSPSDIGCRCNFLEAWIFLNFAKEYRAVRQIEISMVSKLFWEESSMVFFNQNIFQFYGFKTLDLFLLHIGPVSVGMLRNIRVSARTDDPFPTLCHLGAAKNLRNLEISLPVNGQRIFASQPPFRANLKNAKDVVLHEHDEIDFEFHPQHSLWKIDMPKLIKYGKDTTPFKKFHCNLTKFVKRKRNGEYTARRWKYTNHPQLKLTHIMDGTLKSDTSHWKSVKQYRSSMIAEQ